MVTDVLTQARGRLDGYFGISANGSTMKRELMAGTITFLAMSYVLAVNPSVLGDEGALGANGIPMQAVFTATAVAAVFGTLVMGVWARYPIALAPGMGLNAFFAYSVVLGMGIPWQVALAGTFLSGAIFFVLAITKVRERILNAIPTTRTANCRVRPVRWPQTRWAPWRARSSVPRPPPPMSNRRQVSQRADALA